jgi:hypothetical protein
MHAEANRLRSFIEPTKPFIGPLFQRFYVWDKPYRINATPCRTLLISYPPGPVLRVRQPWSFGETQRCNTSTQAVQRLNPLTW